ncbi:MAG TPA: hypothetical protein VKB35_10525 [Ktedonobacteraceae bacterium]|nr:hypothetical protein [Ktedonobacteraceae bacterium]
MKAGQARSADEHTREGGGAIPGWKRRRSSLVRLRSDSWIDNVLETGRNAGTPD